MNNLGLYDLLGMLACWGGVAIVVYVMHDPLIAIIGLAAAYYLSKWMILKNDPEASAKKDSE